MSFNAVSIVGILLDGIGAPVTRVCSWCEKETGRRVPGENRTHGMCRRHFEQQAPDYGYTELQIRQLLAANDEDQFAPDMMQVATPAKATFWPTSGSGV